MINIMIAKKVKQGKKVSSFILKLLNMLNDEANRPYLGWADMPNAFVIFDTNELAKNVLPKYFKHNNLSSFIRQLNIYNFDKIKTEENEHFYHHPCFSKDNKGMLKKIQRKNNFEKEKGRKELHSEDSSFHLSSINESPKNHRKQKYQFVQESPQLTKNISSLENSKQQQIKKVTNFFTMLLKDFSSFELGQIQEMKSLFGNPEKRKNLLEKFDHSELNLEKHPIGFILNGEYFQRKENTREQSRISEEAIQMQMRACNKNKEQSKKDFEEQMLGMEDNIRSQDEGFLPLEENQRFEGSQNMKYQKLFE